MNTRKMFFILVLAIVTSATQLFAQKKVYTVTSGEMLFQWADIQFTDEFLVSSPEGTEVVGSPARFTLFFHLGQYLNIDFNNNIGLITGGAIRNVGFISDERLDLLGGDNGGGDGIVEDYKIIRRSYTLGIPLAVKLGLFDDHFFVFAGGECELAFAYKEKYWNSHNRDGVKTKSTQWFGGQTHVLLPSLYAGIQMPRGINVKFKYYMNDFIDHSYTSQKPISDLTRYKKTQVVYISASWQFETKKVSKKHRDKSSDVRMSVL